MIGSRKFILTSLVGIVLSSFPIANANEIFNYRISTQDANLGLGTIASKHNCFSKSKLIAQLNNIGPPYSIFEGQILKLPSLYCKQSNLEKQIQKIIPLKINLPLKKLNELDKKILWKNTKMIPIEIGNTHKFYTYQINLNNHCLYKNTYSILGELLTSEKMPKQILCKF